MQTIVLLSVHVQEFRYSVAIGNCVHKITLQSRNWSALLSHSPLSHVITKWLSRVDQSLDSLHGDRPHCCSVGVANHRQWTVIELYCWRELIYKLW